MVDQLYLKDVVTLELDENLCTGCGRCAEVCPHAVFKIENRKAAINQKDKCMECGACQKNCPFNAVSVNEGVGCAAAVLSSRKNDAAPNCGCG